MDSVVMQLISAVESRPPIYKIKSKTAKNKEILDRLWKDVAAEMGFPERECRRKWNILRNCYARTLRYERNSKVIHKPWYLQDDLSFLKKHIHPQKSKSEESDNSEMLDLTEASERSSSIDIEPSCFISPLETSHTVMLIPNDKVSSKIESDQHKELELDCVHDIPDEESNSSKITIKSSPIPFEEPVVEVHRTQITDEMSNSNNSNQLFLTSLLPDLNSLSERKQRTFKRKTIELLEFLFEEDQFDATHYQAPASDLDSVLTPSTVEVTARQFDQPILFTVTHKDEPMN